MEQLITNLVVLFGCLLVLVIVLYFSAKAKAHASFVRSGTVELVVAGQSCIKVLANIPGYYIEKVGERFIIKKKDSNKSQGNIFSVGRYLRDNWGFYWISFLYPLKRVLQFRLVSANKLISPVVVVGQKTQVNIRDRIKKENERNFQFLLWQMTHPVLVSNALLKDGTRVDALLLITLEVVDPVQAIMINAGRFFEVFDTAVEGAVSDLFKSKEYADLIGMTKGPAGDESLTGVIQSVNSAKIKIGINDQALETRTVQEVTGVKMVDIFIFDYGTSPEDEEVAVAKRSVLVSELELAVAENKAKGDSVLFAGPVAAMKKIGVPADLAAIQVGSVRKWEQAKGLTGTIVEAGGAGINVNIPAVKPTVPGN